MFLSISFESSLCIRMSIRFSKGLMFGRFVGFCLSDLTSSVSILSIVLRLGFV